MNGLQQQSRKVLIAGVAVLFLASNAVAGGERVLEHRQPAKGIRTLSLDTGVGDVTVTTGDGDEIVARVTLKPRRGGFPFFGSSSKGRRQVEAARLEARQSGELLELGIAGGGKDRRFEENWEVTVPSRLALDLDIGVGDVQVTGVSGGVTVDGGVGDIEIEVPGGNITVDAGVVDVRISIPADAVDIVELDGGVGDCTIHTPDGVVRGKSLGCDASWRGRGTASIDVDSGVGDVDIVCTEAGRR